MYSLRILMAAAALALGHGVRADDYWVDGNNGADLPANGTSPSTPWKTLSYALSRIPHPLAPASHTLWVAGGQVYSLATNGEVFPLTPVPGVAIVGLNARPVLLIPDRQTGIVLDQDQDYDARTRLEHLELRGGTAAVSTGGLLHDHAPEIRDCRFDGQSSEGVYLVPGGFDVCAPRVRQCEFAGVPYSIMVQVWGGFTVQAAVILEVTDCTFENASGAGVWIDHGHDGVHQTGVRVAVDRCRFDGCQAGVREVLETLDATNRVELSVRRSAFRGSSYAGVAVSGPMGGRVDSLVVDACTFESSGAAYGLDLRETRPGPVLIRRCFVRGGATGVSLSAASFLGGTIGPTQIEDTEITGCTLAGLYVGDSSGAFAVTATGCRFTGNRTAVSVRQGFAVGAGSRVQLDSCLLAASTVDGLVIDGDADVVGRFLTIADSASAGLNLVRSGAGTRFEHCVIAGNGTDVAGTPAISWSLVQDRAYPGTGNRQADPLLSRPFYKLTPQSPCIDAGSALLGTPALDYEGDPRILDGGRAAFPDLGADEYVVQGSLHRYGVPGLGAGGLVPVIGSPDVSARLGGTALVALSEARDDTGAPAMAAVLMLGATDRAGPELGFAGAPGSFLWQDAGALLAPVTVSSAGRATELLGLPVAPAALGQSAALQWLVLAPDANQAGLVTTDALRMTLGH